MFFVLAAVSRQIIVPADLKSCGTERTETAEIKIHRNLLQ